MKRIKAAVQAWRESFPWLLALFFQGRLAIEGKVTSLKERADGTIEFTLDTDDSTFVMDPQSSATLHTAISIDRKSARIIAACWHGQAARPHRGERLALEVPCVDHFRRYGSRIEITRIIPHDEALKIFPDLAAA